MHYSGGRIFIEAWKVTFEKMGPMFRNHALAVSRNLPPVFKVISVWKMWSFSWCQRDYFALAATHESRFQATTPAVPFSKENGGRIREGDILFTSGFANRARWSRALTTLEGWMGNGVINLLLEKQVRELMWISWNQPTPDSTIKAPGPCRRSSIGPLPSCF